MSKRNSKFTSKYSKYVIAFSLLVLSVYYVCSSKFANAYSPSLGNVISTSVDGNSLTLTIDNGDEAKDDLLVIDVCDTGVFKVDYRPNSIEPSKDTPIIDPNLSWDKVNCTIDTDSNPIAITTADMLVEISKTPCRMTVKKSDGTTLFYEPNSGGVFHDGVRFERQESTNMYGIHSYDCFSEKGQLLRNDNTTNATAGQQGNSGGPFMWSTAGYGLLVDSDGGYPYTNSSDKKMEFYYGGTPTEGRRYEKSDVEYYIMVGEPKEILKDYSKITGVSPMMPKWSLGFSNFEWNINETELNNMVDTYRAKNIPLDSYALDFDWKKYGENNYGEFAWNTSNFPSAASTDLKTEMQHKGVKLIGITKPRIVTKLSNGTTTIQGNDAIKGDYFYPGHNEYTDYFLPVTVRSIDPYKADQRTWWWEHSKDAFDKGIVGWWNDETDKVSSGGAQYWFGNFTTLHLSQAMYEGQREYTSNQTRVWQTARNYYPGTQRYSTSIWSGDVGSQFYKGEKINWAAGLDEQKAVLLSTVNNGQPKWGMDGGGFNQSSGTIANPSPELYTRWLQFGAFTPVFRVHGNNYQQRQPWFYGNTAEEATKSVIQLRYSLIPYIYSYEREAYDTGLGLIRPLIFDYPSDYNVANNTDSWMFGDWMLVSPVTKKGQSTKWIYLPEGEWLDYNRGKVYTGGTTIPYSLDAQVWNDIPLFIKKGAIIPKQSVQDYVGQDDVKEISVDIFPDSKITSFDYYDDDGNTYNYESSNYLKQSIKAVKVNEDVNVTVEAKEGTYNSGLEYYYLSVHNKAGSSVTMNGSAMTQYDDDMSLLKANGTGWSFGKDIYGEVTYIKIPANSSSQIDIVIAGTNVVQATSQKLEAELASLSGSSVDTKANINTNHTGYSGLGFVDGFNHEDAAVTFYAKVSNAGDYDVSFRYSNGGTASKTMSVFVNGKFEEQLKFEGTSDWNTWGTLTETLPLSAGNNSITIKYNVASGDSGNINMDYISIPFYPNQIVTEAEAGALYGSASTNTNHWFYTGAGFVDGMTSAGAAVSVEANVPDNGNYNTVLRYCNGSKENKTVNVYVNNEYVATITMPGNGGNWNQWNEVTSSLPLLKGRNIISYRYDAGNTGNINIDEITVLVTASKTRERNLLDNGDFERNNSDCNWVEWHPDGQALAYGVDSGSGSNPPDSPWEGDKRAYFYNPGSYQQSIHQGVSVENGSYKVEAWVKTSSTVPSTYRLEIGNYGGSTIYKNLPTTSGWKRIVIDDINVTNGFIDVGIYVASSGGTVVHIDDVKLLKK